MTKFFGLAIVAAGLGLAGCSHEAAPVDNGANAAIETNASETGDLNALDGGLAGNGVDNGADAGLTADNAAGGDTLGNAGGNLSQP